MFKTINIAGLVFILIAIAIVLFTIYYFAYKRTINKRLKEYASKDFEEIEASSKLPTLSSVVKFLVCLIVIIYIFSLNDKINYMSSNIDDMLVSLNYLRFNVNELTSEIEELRDDIDKTNSIVQSVNVSYGEYDKNTKMAKIKYSVKMNEISNDSIVKISINNNEENEMTLAKNGCYECEVSQDIFKTVEKVSVSVVDKNGVRKSEDILENILDEDCEYSEMYNYYISTAYCVVDDNEWDWNYNQKNSEISIKELLRFKLCEITGNPIKSAKIIISIDGKDVDTKDIIDYIKGEYLLDVKYDMNNLSNIIIRLETIDSNGYKYVDEMCGWCDDVVTF